MLRYLTRRQLLEDFALHPPVGEDEAVAALAGAALQTGNPHPPKARARSQPYIPWADLMRRVIEVDVLLCPQSLGKRRIVTFLDDPLVVHRILRHAGLDPEPRPGEACSLVPKWLLNVLSAIEVPDS